MSKPSIREIFFEKDDLNESPEQKYRRAFFSREFSGSITQRMKRILSNRFFRFTRAASYLISHISTRAYGAALICFGLLGTVMHFLGLGADGNIANPIIGILCSLLAIPFLLADKPLPIFLQDFRPTEYIFFEFFCMKRHSVMESEKPFPIPLAIIIGFVPALLSSVIPFWQIALIIGIVICVYIGIESPEFIFLISLFFLPYLRFIPSYDIVLSAALVLAVISFAIKVMHGKRVLYFEQYDICLGAMLLFVLISGVFIKGVESFSGSVRMIILACGYMLAGNIITNRRLAERSANSIIISGAAASLISAIQFVVVMTQTSGEITNESLSHILSRGDGVAVFLMVSTVFSIGIATQSAGQRGALYIISAVLCIVGLVISGEFFALTSLIIGIVAYAIIKSNKLPWLFIPTLLVLSVLLLLLPLDVLDFVFNYSPSIVSAEELFKLWEGSMKAFANNMLVGIGIGKESFVAEMNALGIFGYHDSSNLFIELGLEAGMFALICFILMLITRLKHRSLNYQYTRSSQMGMMSNLSGVCLFGLLAFGMINYIWSEPSAYYLFWCIFGIGSASLRVAKNDYNDRVVYYEESSDFDSSVIDVEIEG